MKETHRLLDSRKTLIGAAVAAALLAAHAPSHAATPIAVRGVVSGSYFTAPTAGAVGSSAASVYAGAKVCFDWNNNGVCDAGEPSATTGSNGSFALTSSKAA